VNQVSSAPVGNEVPLGGYLNPAANNPEEPHTPSMSGVLLGSRELDQQLLFSEVLAEASIIEPLILS